MKIRFASVLAGVATLATTGAMLLVGAGAANAAAPPFEGSDPNETGTLAFYNAGGTQITTGSVTDSPFAAYVVGSTADTTHTKATFYFYTPKNGTAPSAFPGEQVSTSATYPNAGAPAPINSATGPVVPGSSMFETLADYITDVPNTDTSADGYAGLYQARIKTSTDGTYQSADIMVSGTTWTQVFPALATATSTTLTSSENPSTQGDSVTFTATETATGATPHPAGSVQFSVDGTNSGSPVAVNGSGVATFATSSLAVGTHAVEATFTPTDTADFAGSLGTVSQGVQAAKTPTTTSLAIAGNSTTGTDATLSGTVTPAATSGTVSFFDGASATPLNASPVAVTGGTPYTFTLTGGFSAGPHSVVAKFTPTDTTTYNSSQSAPVAFNTASGPSAGSVCANAGSQCTETQTIQGEIPLGTLVISTPYTDANPLDVGTLALSSDGTYWTKTATFECITVTDASSGGSAFAASALANPLSQIPGTGSASQPASAFTTINPENVGLSGITKSTEATCPDGTAPVNSYTGALTAQDNNAANGVAPSDTGSAGLGGTTSHPVLNGSAGGEGTATYDGTLTLNAPTSTAAGTYKGTIVFTVSD